jgi:hypothetical protein
MKPLLRWFGLLAEPLRKVAMYDFHVRLGVEAHPMQYSGRRPHIRWRFASLTDAEKFAHQFGGSIVKGR